MLVLCHLFLFVFCLEQQVVWVTAVSVVDHRQPRDRYFLEWASEVSLCGNSSFGKGLEHVLYCAVLKMVTMTTLFSTRKSVTGTEIRLHINID